MEILGRHVPFTKKEITQSSLKIARPEKQFKAVYSTGGRQGANYKSDGSKYNGGMSPTTVMVYDPTALRQKARNAYQDSVHAHGLVTRWADSIADTGLKLDSTPNFSLLGITPEQAEKWATDVESRFNLWSRSKKQNRSEKQSFYQSHRFYEKNKRRDGECFIRLYYAKDKNLLNPLQFEFIDPSQIRGQAVINTLFPLAQEDGIERDDRGREKSYKVWNSKVVNGQYSYTNETIPRIGNKSKRLMMIHAFEAEYAGQGRGFSGLAHFLQEFEKLTDFTTAQIQKAINQSNIVGAIENNIQDPTNIMEDMPIDPPGGANGNEYGVSAENECDPTTATANDTSSVDSRYDINVCQPNEINNKTPGSNFFLNTRQGDKIKFADNNAPSDSYASFEEAFLSSLSSSDGMPLSVLKMKLEGSFSSARGELLLFWRSVMIGRQNQSTDYLNPVFEMWVTEEIASGRIKAPGWNDPILREAWLSNVWIGSPMPNIDPLRTAKGVKEYLNMNATTAERVAREHNGSEFKSNLMKNKISFPQMAAPYWEKKENQETNNG